VGGYFRALLHRLYINHELCPRLGLLVSVRYNLHEDRPTEYILLWMWKMWVNVCTTLRKRNKHANTEDYCALRHDAVQSDRYVQTFRKIVLPSSSTLKKEDRRTRRRSIRRKYNDFDVKELQYKIQEIPHKCL
jgi:hypothetical protein